MEKKLEDLVMTMFKKTLARCSKEEVYEALLALVKEETKKKGYNDGNRKLYYISAEFLIGKLLSNNLINLGLFEEVRDVLKKNQIELAEIEEIEAEPSLGNGGLGRLAACFLDSIATLGLNGDGIGLNYHLGLFQQVFENEKQKEIKNPWITNQSPLTKTDKSYEILLGGQKVKSVLYDIDVTGYDNKSNKLHLFDIETVDESIVKEGISFDKEDIKKNLTLFLYPDDSDEKGRVLRVYQQYFMVCNAAKLILEEYKEKGWDLRKLHEHVAIQINDTHPSLVIPELIWQLMEQDILMEEAIQIVSQTCAYTNHTILAEALEKWPIDYLMKVVPHLMPIIKELDSQVKKKYADPAVAIIDKDKKVHMAHMDIHYGHSVNGVAALHTEILKNSELKNFYDIYPEKFNNKTNGITFRRWLIHCNPLLTEFITKLIGSDFKKNSTCLEALEKFGSQKEVLDTLAEIKQKNKTALKNHLFETQGVIIDDTSIYDIQVKRLHEYKRQQMNALYVIYKYLEIKKGKKPKRPITVIFGAKAAPAYIIAKDIIHLILCLQTLIRKDPEVSPYLNVLMVENYNVTNAEKLIPACDVSEQISLASKEASGTGNMKFMLNGAITLGTMDGANVEIHDLVGKENIYIFGESSETVIGLYAKEAYKSKAIYEKDAKIKELVDFIVGDRMLKIGCKENLDRLYKEILNKDWFMTLLDLKEYIATKEQVFDDYEDRNTWNKKMLVNISKAGFFSSDRSIAQYNKDIWHL